MSFGNPFVHNSNNCIRFSINGFSEMPFRYICYKNVLRNCAFYFVGYLYSLRYEVQVKVIKVSVYMQDLNSNLIFLRCLDKQFSVHKKNVGLFKKQVRFLSMQASIPRYINRDCVVLSFTCPYQFISIINICVNVWLTYYNFLETKLISGVPLRSPCFKENYVQRDDFRLLFLFFQV